MPTSALVWFIVSLAAGRIRDVIVAAVVLAATSPLLLWYRLRRADGPLFTDISVTGRHGQPFALRTFAVEPENRWMRRLPWFITLLMTRHLTLFGPCPSPHETAVTVARTDPRVQRRPGIFAIRTARSAPEPAPPPPRLPEAHRS